MAGFSTNGLPTTSSALTGAELIEANTQLTAGLTPQTEAISVNQIAAFTRGASGAGVTYRNVLDGGDFTTNPFQRGTSLTGITNTSTYLADRWFNIGSSGSSISVSRQPVTVVTGFSQALEFGRGNTNADVNPIKMGQVLETNRSVGLQGQTVILSFYAAPGGGFSAANGQLNALIYTGTGTNDTAANMVAAAWAGQTTANAVTSVNLVTGWVRYYVVGVIPVTATQIGVLFSYTPVGTATTDFIQLSGIQLEAVNAVATQATAATYASAFEKRSPDIELNNCQRTFYQITEAASSSAVFANGMISATNVQTIVIPLPVTMYKAPTVTVTAGTLKFNIAGTATAVGAGFAAGTCTPTEATVVGAVTATAGQATQLQAGNSTGGGIVAISADF
jgi:hypothetical protein